MKKLDAILKVGLLVAIVGVMLLGSYLNGHYTMKCVAIDKHTFKDSTGHTWTISDNLKVGKEYRVVFNNNCTDNTRNDDTVVKFN